MAVPIPCPGGDGIMKLLADVVATLSLIVLVAGAVTYVDGLNGSLPARVGVAALIVLAVIALTALIVQ